MLDYPLPLEGMRTNLDFRRRLTGAERAKHGWPRSHRWIGTMASNVALFAALQRAARRLTLFGSVWHTFPPFGDARGTFRAAIFVAYSVSHR